MDANKDILAKHPWRKGARFHLKLSIWKEWGYSHPKDTKEHTSGQCVTLVEPWSHGDVKDLGTCQTLVIWRDIMSLENC